MANSLPFIRAAAIAAAGITGLTAATAASAADGIYVSGSISATELGHSISRNTGVHEEPSISTLTEETDVSLRLGLGYKYHVTDRAFVAVEAFYSWENGSTRSLNGVLASELDLDATFGGDARFGYDVTENFAVYGLAGVTWVDFDNDTGYTFAPPTQFLSDTQAGFTYGFGAELALSERISLIGEYRITNDISFTPNADRVGELVNANSIDLSSMRFGVNFSF